MEQQNEQIEEYEDFDTLEQTLFWDAEAVEFIIG